MRIIKGLGKIGLWGIIKTLWFNFRFIPFKEAIFLPVLLSSKVEVQNMRRGRIVLDGLGGGQIWHSENWIAGQRILL